MSALQTSLLVIPLCNLFLHYESTAKHNSAQHSCRSTNTASLICRWHLDKEAISIICGRDGQSWLAVSFPSGDTTCNMIQARHHHGNERRKNKTADGVFIKEFKAVGESKISFCGGNVAIGPLDTKRCQKMRLINFSREKGED